jgi:MoaA/NifB/PqqE/SkfB family radical SAM enzyme
VRGAWQNTVEGAAILNRTGLPFIVQTTAGSHNLGELEAIADFAHDRLAAKVWNLYFLVPTGRGQFVSDMTPAQYDEVLSALYLIQRKYKDRMLVNAKCAPHYIKAVLEHGGSADPVPADGDSSPIRIYSGGAGGCPAGTHYMGIRPNGDVTPCPYLPVFAGTLRNSSLAELWDVLGAVHRHSPPRLARRAMRGVRDERALRGLSRAGLRDDRRRDGRGSALHAHPWQFAGSPC